VKFGAASIKNPARPSWRHGQDLASLQRYAHDHDPDLFPLLQQTGTAPAGHAASSPSPTWLRRGDHATRIMKSLTMLPGPEDLRSWLLHVCDDLGVELFVMPFTFVLGKPH